MSMTVCAHAVAVGDTFAYQGYLWRVLNSGYRVGRTSTELQVTRITPNSSWSTEQPHPYPTAYEYATWLQFDRRDASAMLELIHDENTRARIAQFRRNSDAFPVGV